MPDIRKYMYRAILRRWRAYQPRRIESHLKRPKTPKTLTRRDIYPEKYFWYCCIQECMQTCRVHQIVKKIDCLEVTGTSKGRGDLRKL